LKYERSALYLIFTFICFCHKVSIYLVCFAQYVSEKIGGAKGTELDDEFTEMEKVIILLYILDTSFYIYVVAIKWIYTAC